MDVSFQKLRLLKMSLENRMEEFPSLAKEEQNGDLGRPVLPRPAQLTGTFYLKLLGVEGLLDIYTLRQSSELDKSSSPPRTFSIGHMNKNNTRNFMTLPNPHHRDRDRDKEKGMVTSDEEGVGGSSTNTWYRRGSKHGRSKASLQKQHSLDHIDDASSQSPMLYYLQ